MPARRKADFIERVADALRSVPVRAGDRVLIALSGGPDSVALLHAMLALRARFGISVAAAHLNHRLRESESERDEAFVRELAARLQLGLLVERAEGLSPKSSNLEERAREIRYAFLERAARRCGAAYIALGHHLDDQAETVLMRLMRGAGVAGLSAMAPVDQKRRLIRPLLSLTRAEIIGWLNSIGARYVTDRSNLSGARFRNRVRHRLLPLLENESAPGVARRLAALAAEARSINAFLIDTARRELERVARVEDGGRPGGAALNIPELVAMPAPIGDAILREFLRDRIGDLRRIGRAHIAALRRLAERGPTNGRVSLPDGWVAERCYGRLAIVRKRARCQPVLRPIPVKLRGITSCGYGGVDFSASRFEAKGIVKASNLMEALFDGDLVEAGLRVDFVRPGLRVAPVGLRGHRKLKDVFIDHKVPRGERGVWPVVMLGKEVAWVPGLVRGRVALVNEASRNVLLIRATRSERERICVNVVAP